MMTHAKIKGLSIARLCTRLRNAGGPLCVEAAERIDRLSAKDAEIASLRAELAKSEENNRLANERHLAAARQDAETIERLLKLANGFSDYAVAHELRGRWMAELKELKRELEKCNARDAALSPRPPEAKT